MEPTVHRKGQETIVATGMDAEDHRHQKKTTGATDHAEHGHVTGGEHTGTTH